MGKTLLYFILSSTFLIALFRPWVGIVATYCIIILTPQSIWWWHFEDMRPVFFVLLPTIAGLIIAIFQGTVKFKIIYSKINLYMLVLFYFYINSYFIGPYVDVYNQYRFHDAYEILQMVIKIFLLYFMSCLCIDNESKLKCLCGIFVLSTIYLVYWINDQYLFKGRFGRISGPSDIFGGGLYVDENAFAMLFVTGIPFIYYAGCYVNQKIVKYALWSIIPLGWHAIFLTGSRGGLVGLAATLIFFVFCSKNKSAIIIFPLFFIFYTWQAGDLMKTRTQTITNQQESSSASRIEAWTTASSMIKTHPITGVGLGSFGQAYPSFSDFKPREAHNTFLQISAEAGIFAGFAYIAILFKGLSLSWKRRKMFLSSIRITNNFLYLANEATLISFFGLLVCSLFLSLQLYEIFFYLCVLINTIGYLISKGQKDEF